MSAEPISDQEHAERISRTRAEARKRGLDGLIVYGAHRDYHAADLRYLARWYCVEEETACLVVPAKPDSATTLITDADWDLSRAQDEAVADRMQSAPDLGDGIVAALRGEVGEARRIGIAGFEVFPVPAYLMITQGLPGVELEDASNILTEQRIIKSDTELAILREAAEISDAGMAAGLGRIRPGGSEIEAAAAAENAIKERGAELSFVTNMAAGPRTALDTFYPRNEFREGDVAVLDCGARLHGYHGDMCRSVIVGDPDSRQVEILETVLRAVERAIDTATPGTTVGAVRDAAADEVREAGFGDYWWDAFMPHGNGIGQHEPPNGKEHPERELEPGMVLCIEPGISIPDEGAYILEQMIAIRDGKPEVLNKLPLDLWAAER